jgi:ectoine hydroxylase-related dioxygenase (phytanoyl-CoA dioxygenase family)
MEWSKEVEVNGFAIQHDVLPADWMSEILDQDIRRSPMRSRAGLRHAMLFGSVRVIAQGPSVKRLACEVLGKGAFPFSATIFEKSPGANWLVAWHQDTALPVRYRSEAPGWGAWSTKQGIPYVHAPGEVLSQVLALRIHLDDSTPENGPLRVLPGTHALGVLSDDRIHELANQIAAVDCVVPKGGVVAMRPLLVHASSKSHTEAPRRVLHIAYAASDSIASPLELETV